MQQHPLNKVPWLWFVLIFFSTHIESLSKFTQSQKKIYNATSKFNFLNEFTRFIVDDSMFFSLSSWLSWDSTAIVNKKHLNYVTCKLRFMINLFLYSMTNIYRKKERRWLKANRFNVLKAFSSVCLFLILLSSKKEGQEVYGHYLSIFGRSKNKFFD